MSRETYGREREGELNTGIREKDTGFYRDQRERKIQGSEGGRERERKKETKHTKIKFKKKIIKNGHIYINLKKISTK